MTKSHKKLDLLSSSDETIISIQNMVHEHYAMVNTFDPAKIMVKGIISSVENFFIPNTDKRIEELSNQLKLAWDIDEAKREFDLEQAGNTQTRPDKLKVSEAIDNVLEGKGALADNLMVAKDQLNAFWLLLDDLKTSYRAQFLETYVRTVKKPVLPSYYKRGTK